MKYTMSFLHELLAHLNQDYIRFMINNDFLSSKTSSIFDLSGSIDCESCRLFKSQAQSKLPHKSYLKKQATSTLLSDIPEDLLSSSNISVKAHEPLFRVHVDGFEFHFPGSTKCFYIFTDEATDFKLVYSVVDKTAESFLKTVQTFHAFAYYHHKTNIKTIRMDNASEMSSEIFYDYARFNNIHLQRCAPYEHHQNGTAERSVRTCEETALTLLHHAHLSVPLFIVYAVSNAVQIRNKCVTKRTKLRMSSPFELFTGVKPKLEDIHIIGQTCYSYIQKDQRKFKYHPKARQCIFLCEDYERKSFLVMDVENRTVISSRDVRFPRVGSTPILPATISPLSQAGRQASTDCAQSGENNDTADNSMYNGNFDLNERSLGDVPLSVSAPSDGSVSLPRPTTPTLDISEKSWDSLYYDGGASTSDSAITGSLFPRFCETDSESEEEDGRRLRNDGIVNPEPNIDVPTYVPEIQRDSDNDDCTFIEVQPRAELAVESEADNTTPLPVHSEATATPASAHGQNPSGITTSGRRRTNNSRYYNEEFVNLISLPDTPSSYKQAITSPEKEKWDDAMKKELKALEQQRTWDLVPRLKGMFVVRSKWVYKIKLDEHGSIERYKARVVAIGFTQTYGKDFDETFSPVLHATTRRLLFSLAANPRVISLQADVETAFLQSDLDHVIFLLPPPGMVVPDDFVLKLNRAIYGLKQSPLLWYVTVSEFLLSIGFTKCVSDICLFLLVNDLGTITLCVYVDDLILTSESQALIDWVLVHLRRRFPIRDVKKLCWTVGLHVSDGNNGNLHMSQSVYIRSLVNRYLNDDATKKSHIPMRVDNSMGDELSILLSSTDVKVYQKLVGSLNYLAHASRPDIMFAVNSLSRFLQRPREVHMNAGIHVVKYLNSTPELSLLFTSAVGELMLFAFCDASFAAEALLDGRSVTGILIFLNGNLIYWKTIRQAVISLSAMESELHAIAQTVVELQHIANILFELFGTMPKRIIYTDSEPAIKYLYRQSDVLKPRTRHLCLKFHFIRKEIQDGILELKYVSSKMQKADMLTKPLPRPQFEFLRNLIFEK